MKHKTSHAAEAVDGKALVYCESCSWSDVVDIESLPYREAMEAIFKARDEHEAQSANSESEKRNGHSRG